MSIVFFQFLNFSTKITRKKSKNIFHRNKKQNVRRFRIENQDIIFEYFFSCNAYSDPRRTHSLTLTARLSRLILDNGIHLEKKGKCFVGKCPFHVEKSPSFFVDDRKGLYHCFGCGASGNMFSFEKFLHNKISSKNALDADGKNQTQYLTYFTGKKEKLCLFTTNFNLVNFEIFHIIQVSSFFFSDQLTKFSKPKILLQLRNVSFATIILYQIGFAPDNKKRLLNFLLYSGFSPKQIIKSGLVFFKKTSEPAVKSETIRTSKNDYYFWDMFIDRIIIPIRNSNGFTIGFGGRLISKKKLPKYLNSSESEIFKKKLNLFSHSMIKSSLYIPSKAILIVEGYLDTVALFQNGIRFSVASLGTSFSKNQINKSKKFCENYHIIFCFDSDIAGRNGIWRIFQKTFFRRKNKNIFYSIAEIPEIFSINDPDEFVQKKGSSIFNNEILNQSISPMIWYENFIFNDLKTDLIFVKNLFDSINFTTGISELSTVTSDHCNSTFQKLKFCRGELDDQNKFSVVFSETLKKIFELQRNRERKSIVIIKKQVSRFLNGEVNYPTTRTYFYFFCIQFYAFKNDISCVFFSCDILSYFSEIKNRHILHTFIRNPEDSFNFKCFKKMVLMNSREKIDVETLRTFVKIFFASKNPISKIASPQSDLLNSFVLEEFFFVLRQKRKAVTKNVDKLVFFNNYLKKKNTEEYLFSETYFLKKILAENIKKKLEIVAQIDKLLDKIKYSI